MWLRAAAAGLLCAVAAAGVALADSAVEVDPLVGTPETSFHVEVAATFPIRQLRDRYWFVLHGPGGRQCETTVTDRVGITPPRRAKRVAVDLPGVRVVSSRQIVPGPWCPGTFRGHVEFRDWRPRTRRYVVRRIGEFSVQVKPTATNSRPPSAV
jgi:hypothetical protein